MKIEGIPIHKCLVCYNDFNMADKAPVCLPCGHVFCKNCVMVMRQLQYSKCLRCKVDWSRSQICDLPVIALLVRQMSTDSGVCDGGAPCVLQEDHVNQETEVSKTVEVEQGSKRSDGEVEENCNANESDGGSCKSNEQEIAATNIHATERRSTSNGKIDKTGNNSNGGDMRQYFSAMGTERGSINTELGSNSNENSKGMSDIVETVESILMNAETTEAKCDDPEVKGRDFSHAVVTGCCNLTIKTVKESCRITDEKPGRSCDDAKTENMCENITKTDRESDNTKISESDNSTIHNVTSTSHNPGNVSMNSERSYGAGRGNDGKYKRKRNRGSKKKKDNIKKREASVKNEENLGEDKTKDDTTPGVCVRSFREEKIDLNQTCDPLKHTGQTSEKIPIKEVDQENVKSLNIEEEGNKNYCSNSTVQNIEPLIQELIAESLVCQSKYEEELHDPDTHLKGSCSDFPSDNETLNFNCMEREGNQININKTKVESEEMSPAKVLTNNFLPSALNLHGDERSQTYITASTHTVKAIMAEVFVERNSTPEVTNAPGVFMNTFGVQEEITRTKPVAVQTETTAGVDTCSGDDEDSYAGIMHDKQNVAIINALALLDDDDDEATIPEGLTLEVRDRDHFQKDATLFLQDKVDDSSKVMFVNGSKIGRNTSGTELKNDGIDFRDESCKVPRNLDVNLREEGNLTEKIHGLGTPNDGPQNDDDKTNNDGSCFGSEIKRDTGSVEPLLRDLLARVDAVDKQLSNCVSNVEVDEEKSDIGTKMPESRELEQDVLLHSHLCPSEPVQKYEIERTLATGPEKITSGAPDPKSESVDILDFGVPITKPNEKDEEEGNMREKVMGREGKILSNDEVFVASEMEKNSSGIQDVSADNEKRNSDGLMNGIMHFGPTENEQYHGVKAPVDSDHGGKETDNTASLSNAVNQDNGKTNRVNRPSKKGNGHNLGEEKEDINKGLSLSGEKKENTNMGAPPLGEEDEEIEVGAPLLAEEPKEINMGAPLLNEAEGAPIIDKNEDDINMGVPLFDEDEDNTNMGAPLFDEDEDDINMGVPLFDEDEDNTNMGAPFFDEDDDDINMGVPLFDEDEDDINMGVPLFDEDEDDINMGVPLFDEDEDDINMGVPLFDEDEDNTDMGAQLFDEDEDDINMGAPLFDEDEDDINMGVRDGFFNNDDVICEKFKTVVEVNLSFGEQDNGIPEQPLEAEVRNIKDGEDDIITGPSSLADDQTWMVDQPHNVALQGNADDFHDEFRIGEFRSAPHPQRIEEVMEDECRVRTESDETPSSTTAETSHGVDITKDDTDDDVNGMYRAKEDNGSNTVAAPVDKTNSSNNRSKKRRREKRKPNVLVIDKDGVVYPTKESVKRQRAIRKNRGCEAKNDEDKDVEDAEGSKCVTSTHGRSILLYITAPVVLMFLLLLWLLSPHGHHSITTPPMAGH